MIRTMLLIITTILISSCASSWSNITKSKVSIDYIVEKEDKDCTKELKINVENIDKFILPDETEKEVEKRFFLPLGIIYVNNYDLLFALGQNSIIEKYPDIILKKLNEQGKSNICLEFNTDKDSEYKLIINFVETGAVTAYSKRDLFTPFYFSFNEQNYSGNSRINASVTFYHKDSQLFKRIYEINEESMRFGKGSKSKKLLRLGAIGNMTDALSKAIKSLVEQIIQDINYEIKNN